MQKAETVKGARWHLEQSVSEPWQADPVVIEDREPEPWHDLSLTGNPMSDLFLAEAKTALALAFARMGAFAQAAALYIEVIWVLEEKLGPNHPAVAWRKVMLATIYRQDGKYHLADKYYRQAAPVLESGVWSGLKTDWERFRLCFNFTAPSARQWTTSQAAA